MNPAVRDVVASELAPSVWPRGPDPSDPRLGSEIIRVVAAMGSCLARNTSLFTFRPALAFTLSCTFAHATQYVTLYLSYFISPGYTSKKMYYIYIYTYIDIYIYIHTYIQHGKCQEKQSTGRTCPSRVAEVSAGGNVAL